MFDKEYNPVAKRLIERLPLFLKEEVATQARTHQKIVAKPLQDLETKIRIAQTITSLNRPLQLWREQIQPHNYTIKARITLKDIMRVRVYEDDWLIYDSSRLKKGTDYFEESLQLRSHNIIPDHEYKLVVEDYDGNTYKKGIPEDPQRTDEFKPDPILDNLGKLHGIQRFILEPVGPDGLARTYPPFHNQPVEPDYYYAQRMINYLRIWNERGLIYAEFYKWFTYQPSIVGYWRVLARQNRTPQIFHTEEDVGSFEMATAQRNASVYIVYVDPDRVPANLKWDDKAVDNALNTMGISKKFIFKIPIKYEYPEGITISDDVTGAEIKPVSLDFLNIDDNIVSMDTTTTVVFDNIQANDVLAGVSVLDVVADSINASEEVSQVDIKDILADATQLSEYITTITADGISTDAVSALDEITGLSADNIASESVTVSDTLTEISHSDLETSGVVAGDGGYAFSGTLYVKQFDTDTEFQGMTRDNTVISGTGTGAILTIPSGDTGYKNPGTATNVDYSNCSSLGSWYNLSNALTQNDSGAVASTPAQSCYTDILQVSGYSFGVPSNAQITGVQVKIRRRQSGTVNRVDQLVQINVGGTNSNNKADTSTYWPQSYTDKTYGGSSDLWGLSNITPSNINTLAVKLSAKNNYSSVGASFFVDVIQARVYYLVPQSGTASYSLGGSTDLKDASSLGTIQYNCSIPSGCSISYTVNDGSQNVASGSLSSGAGQINLTGVTVDHSRTYTVTFTLNGYGSSKPSIDYIKHNISVSGSL